MRLHLGFYTLWLLCRWTDRPETRFHHDYDDEGGWSRAIELHGRLVGICYHPTYKRP